ncbi:DNA-binding protein rfx7 [Clonorchis sinensis]|uniref:DNA-binding protein rfx7 n=1 Tax=Clonorchis sinensis TaxID=79923 RepID=A0A8T1MY62_CLOSI|nr:DNA-binding protein rfx7 [Clonorchis sinensis]
MSLIYDSFAFLMLKPGENDVCSNRNGSDYLRATLSASLNPDARARVDSLVQEVASLKDIEKLLFCLLLPIDNNGGQHSFIGSALTLHPEDTDLPGHGFELSTLGVGLFSPGGSSSLHLSNQVEQSQAYTWIMSHLEEHPSTCLRKDEVYEDYRAYCDKHHMKTLNTADFGKVMKRAFPNVKPRRLGQRGQSRYCYGGMRKKMEVQPPFLPDLTDEALGMSAQGRSTTSPASSSETSGELGSHRRRISSTSPLTRLLCANGSELDHAVWADEPGVRSALGVRGSVVSDVAHILLEYAQQVFGVQFQSLFHLAQHLVSNRYVNSRSRYAFSLIAHAASTPASSLSPPPSAALAEALQKGLPKSAFDRVTNGRRKSGGDRPPYLKPEESIPSTSDLSRTPTRHTQVPGSPAPVSTPTAHHPVTATAQSPLLGGTNRGFSTDATPSASLSDLSSSHLPPCSTPQPSYRPYQANFSPQASLPPSCLGGGLYAAAAALASQTGVPSSCSPYLFNSGRGDSSALKNSSAAVALAAAAAAAARQAGLPHFNSNSTPSGYSASMGIIPGRSSPIPPASQFDVLTPPTAHKEKATSFPAPSTPGSNPSETPYHQIAGYHSPVGGSGTIYAAHQQTPPYTSLQHTPAPLPPGVGARSPYTPTANPGTAVSDTTQSTFKRSIPPHPVEAPGAYEPSPRFHLGGQSPNKRARYLSTASGGSSGTTPLSAECPPLSSGSTADSMDAPFGDPSSGMAHGSVSSSSPASSAGSSTRGASQQPTPLSMGPGYASQLGTGESQSGTIASPYYSSRYEGLEMRSPAPHHHHHQMDRVNRLPNMTAAPLDSSLWGTSSASRNPNKISVTPGSTTNQQGYGPTTTDARPSGTVFRPPVTPFILELEEDDDLTNMPRLGASPGPQIPPSSPTEFLPFYSEAASKSVQAKRKLCGSHTTKSRPGSEGEECGSGTGSSCSPGGASLGTDSNEFRTFVSSHLETPPSSALMPSATGQLCSDSLVSPDSPTSDNSCDRTLTNFDQYGEVNTPPMPEGLASAPSPSDMLATDALVQQRQELQSELSTPGPADSDRSLALKPELTPATSRSNPSDVGIPAF